MKVSYKNNIIMFYIFAVASLVVATFLDLKIDIQLNNPQNPFAIWFCNTGEIPCRMICPFAGAMLFKFCEKNWQKIIGALVCLGGSAYFGTYIAKYFFIDDKNNVLFGIVYGIGFGVVALIVGKYLNINEKYAKAIVYLAIVGIVIMIVQLASIEGIKYLWGRVRFRDLDSANNYAAFTPWYKINGLNGNKSFPSGHTAGAGMSYILMLLPLFFDKFKSKKNLCFFVPLVYTSIVAFTRLVMGAHYLSDVTVGGTISFTIVVITICIMNKKGKLS